MNKNFLIGLGLGYLFTQRARRNVGSFVLPGDEGRSRRRGRGSTEEIRKLVAEYALQHGEQEAVKKFNLSVQPKTIRTWMREFGLIAPGAKHLSKEQKREIADYSSEHGVKAAAQKFNVSVHRVYHVRQEFRLAGKRAKVTPIKTRIAAAEEASVIGIPAAAKKYKVGEVTIASWRKKHGKTTKRTKPQRKWTKKEKIEIINYANEHTGEEAAKKFGTHSSNITKWRKELKMLRSQPYRYRRLEILRMINEDKDPFDSFGRLNLRLGGEIRNRLNIHYKQLSQDLSSMRKQGLIKSYEGPDKSIDKEAAAYSFTHGMREAADAYKISYARIQYLRKKYYPERIPRRGKRT